VVGVPGRAVEEGRRVALDLEHGRLPDPVSEAIRHVLEEQEHLAQRLKRLEESLNVHGAAATDKPSKEPPMPHETDENQSMAHG